MAVVTFSRVYAAGRRGETWLSYTWIRTLGLIVALTAIPLMYCPRTAAGLRSTTWLMKAVMLSASFGRVEAQLAHHGVDVAAGVVAELHLARLVLLDDLAHVRRDGAGPRRRHQAAGAEDLAQRADHAHHVGRGDADVEIGPAALDLFGQFRPADFVGPGGLGLVDLVALGEHHHPQRLADAVGQHDRAAHQLVGLLRVDAQPDRDLDRLVELRGVEGFQNGHGLGHRQRLLLRRHLLQHGRHAFG